MVRYAQYRAGRCKLTENLFKQRCTQMADIPLPSQSDSNNTIHIFYQDIESNGLKYIQKQKQYLIVTAIFPIYAIILQIFNLIVIIKRIAPPPPQFPRPPFLEPRNIYDIITPIIVFLVISTFALVKFVFLLIWMKKVRQYESFQKSSEEGSPSKEKSENDSPSPTGFTDPVDLTLSPEQIKFEESQSGSLTRLFYDIVSHMQSIRVIFLLLNLTFIFYFQWFIGFLFSFFGITTNLHPQPDVLFQILNVIAQFGLIWYMVFEWRHFIRWNRKLRHLVAFEKQVYFEIES